MTKVSNEEQSNNANVLLPAVFIRELADLMKKHNATIELERVWDDEYSSHAELSFKVGEKIFR
jgi:hypothetical protein